MEDVVGARARVKRLTQQAHPCLLWRPSRFSVIAAFAGGDEIFPGVSATLESRNDVIECQVVRLLTAIHAGEVIALEHLTTREAHLRPGTSDHVDEADD